MRGDGKGVGWPGPWPSTVPITWANLGVGDEDVLQAGVASRDHISIFAKLCWLLRKHGRRGEDDQGNHSYHGVLGCRGGSRQAAWPSFGEPLSPIVDLIFTALGSLLKMKIVI